MRTVAILMLLALSTSPVDAGVYKCEVNGVTTFSDVPCGGQEDEMALRVDPPTQRSQERSHYEGMDEIINTIAEERNRAHIKRLLRDKKGKIVKLERHRSSEVARLQQLKSTARNNRAGAIWAASLVGEMRVVNEQTAAETSQLRSQINDIEQQLR